MAQVLPRMGFDGSSLVRVLTDFAVTDLSESKQPSAERLGQWLAFTDTLSLFSALNIDAAGEAPVQSAPRLPASAGLRQEYARVRRALTDAITDRARFEPPTSSGSATDFAPWHRSYLALQRDMGASIGSLRGTVRAALSRQSPRLRHLAVLDAVLDRGLAARERELLATVPVLLGRRFEQRCAAHLATQTDARAEDDPDPWELPGGWLAQYFQEMQAVLLAELELRLQPVAGLIAAIDTRQ